ncbi:MAG: phosphatidylglycerophosphatase A [Myxococcales bacterium]
MKKPAADHPRPPLKGTDVVALAVATGFGTGYAPVASGTFGTLVGIPAALLVAQLDAWWLQLLTIAAFCAVAMLAAARAARALGAREDGHTVSNEIAGYLVTMALVPISLKTVVAGFFLFRIFDILKPWPASYFDRKVHTGIGNVMDDVCAAFYARACMALLLWLWP